MNAPAFQDRLRFFLLSLWITTRFVRYAGAGFCSANSLTLDDPHQHGDDGDNQEQVNEATHRVGAHHPEQPQDEEDYKDRPEHHGPPVGYEDAGPTDPSTRKRKRMVRARLETP